MHQRAIVGVIAALGILALATLSIVFALTPTTRVEVFEDPDAAPAPAWAPAAEAPTPAAIATGPGVAGLVDADWLTATAERTGIPSRALAAYAGVALNKAASMPSCGLAWNTLAAIGFAESRHGSHEGSTLGADGTVTPGIFGVALAGGDTEHIADSDGGAIDGDADYDRAVGPMQLIPQTWRNWHIDANGDGVEDPQNIDDAVMATANYLCRASGDMTTESGWRAGIAAYNGAESYLRAVAAAGVEYAG
jgi:membrane-bound lytic murein transglycosylase B